MVCVRDTSGIGILAIKVNTVTRGTVVIDLLDEAGEPKVVWTLHKAWPIKITAIDVKSGSDFRSRGGGSRIRVRDPGGQGELARPVTLAG